LIAPLSSEKGETKATGIRVDTGRFGGRWWERTERGLKASGLF
jgi:hypothetical protein